MSLITNRWGKGSINLTFLQWKHKFTTFLGSLATILPQLNARFIDKALQKGAGGIRGVGNLTSKECKLFLKRCKYTNIWMGMMFKIHSKMKKHFRKCFILKVWTSDFITLWLMRMNRVYYLHFQANGLLLRPTCYANSELCKIGTYGGNFIGFFWHRSLS